MGSPPSFTEHLNKLEQRRKTEKLMQQSLLLVNSSGHNERGLTGSVGSQGGLSKTLKSSHQQVRAAGSHIDDNLYFGNKNRMPKAGTLISRVAGSTVSPA